MVSWAIIVKKALQLRKAQAESAKFLDAFWQSKRLDAIYQAAEELPASPHRRRSSAPATWSSPR